MSEQARRISVQPCKQGLSGKVMPPSSKYHTLRYLLSAMLAQGECFVYYPALSDDTDALLQACRALGEAIEEQKQADGRLVLRVQGTGGASPAADPLCCACSPPCGLAVLPSNASICPAPCWCSSGTHAPSSRSSFSIP